MTNPGDASGAFTEVRLVHHAAVADLFSAKSADGRPVVIVALTPEAGADQAWRAAFADLIARDRATVNPADPQYVVAHAGDLNGPRPWVANHFLPGRRGIERVLTVIPGALPTGVDPSAMVGSALFGASVGTAAPASAPPSAQPATPQWSTPAEQPATPTWSTPAEQPATPPWSSPSPPPLNPVSAYAAPPPYPAAPYPAPAGPEPSGRGRAGILIGLITLVTVLVMVGAGFAVLLLKNNSKDETPNAAPPTVAASSPLPADTAGPSPTPSHSPLPSTTPALRPTAKQISVVGPTWKSGEKTQLLTLPGWPFAFRMPEGWSCLRGSSAQIPDADVWGCVKTEGASHQQRATAMLRRCPTTCTADEQATMNNAWFDVDERPNVKTFDPTTYYIEVPKNDNGFYAIDFSHFYANTVGGTLTYEVGFWFQSPPQYKQELEKTLNDIRSQAPQPS